VSSESQSQKQVHRRGHKIRRSVSLPKMSLSNAVPAVVNIQPRRVKRKEKNSHHKHLKSENNQKETNKISHRKNRNPDEQVPESQPIQIISASKSKNKKTEIPTESSTITQTIELQPLQKISSPLCKNRKSEIVTEASTFTQTIEPCQNETQEGIELLMRTSTST